MLNAYDGRLAALRERANAPRVTLPFVPAPTQRVATATARLHDLIARPGYEPPMPVAEVVTPVLIGPVRLATRPGATVTEIKR